MKIELKTEYRGREVTGAEAARLRHEAAIGLEVTRILASQPRLDRPVDAPDRASVRRAMATVEARIVEAIWTLARVPMPGFSPSGPHKHGIEYLQDVAERFANAVAAGGVWEQDEPRPPKPSSRAIDAMWEPLEWLRARDAGGFLDHDRCRLLWAAAATKRGDTARNVAWRAVVEAVPELRVLAVRSLQRRYEDGLRAIVAELLARGGE